MTTLMPESPGHWSESVLIAFPDACLTQDYPEVRGGGVVHVTLSLEDDLEIEFRRDEFVLPDAPQSYSANLQDYDADRNLVGEELLFESSDIDILNEAVTEWLETYHQALVDVDKLIADAWGTETTDEPRR